MLADASHEISYLIFSKIGKDVAKFSSAAFAIGASRVNIAFLFLGRRMRHSGRGNSPTEAIETGPVVNQLDCHRLKIINNNLSFFVFGPCLSVISSFAIISLRKRELVALHSLSSCCHVAVSVLCLFLLVPWIGQ